MLLLGHGLSLQVSLSLSAPIQSAPCGTCGWKKHCLVLDLVPPPQELEQNPQLPQSVNFPSTENSSGSFIYSKLKLHRTLRSILNMYIFYCLQNDYERSMHRLESYIRIVIYIYTSGLYSKGYKYLNINFIKLVYRYNI